jgi:HEAT repeat protein
MRRSSSWWPIAVLAAAALGCADVPTSNEPRKDAPRQDVAASTEPVKVDPAINTTLVDILEKEDKEKIDLTTILGTPLGDILTVGSPIGFTLRNRYLNIGIPIAEALSRNTDPDFRSKLVTLARWDKGETRAAALVTLAQSHDIKDLDVFREAQIHLDPAVRFGALEALQVWQHPEYALPLLAAASEKDPEPILRVYSAAGLARLGDTSGLVRLRMMLDDPSWLVRAMAGRYLGDFGTAEDYGILVSRIGREMGNDFVVAEYCIAGLKLFPKKRAADELSAKNLKPSTLPSKAPPAAGRGNIPDESESAFQLEPLVITAPRVQAQNAPIDPQINQQLLRLLQQRMDARPDQAALLDASLQNLSKLSTLTGYNLKTRYTELGFLLTEGLAGTEDYQLASELEKVVRLGQNPQTRAAAMVALAYTHDMRYLSLLQGASTDQNITVRFGALEALLILDNPATTFQVGSLARTDPSLPIQIYAAAGMWRMGDIYGREILLRLYQHPDWFVRAMATHYMGELGRGDEYRRLLIQLPSETHASVKAELTSALLRLQQYKD